MESFKNKKNIPLYIFSVLITAFFLFFSKIILKSDDGHFIGILSENGFNLFEWLEYRYESISGRTVCEFLTMMFFSINPLFNKLLFSLLWIVFVYLLMKAVSAYGQNSCEEKVFICSIPFSVLITCLNSGAIWFSGGFTYFVPFIFMIIALSPSIFEVLDVEYKKIILVPASVICAFMSSSQEQASALTVTFLTVLIVILIKSKKIKIYHILPLISSAIETYLLFSAPGISKRTDMESVGYELFNLMNIFEKLLCGFSNYFAFQFLMSFFVSGLFVFLLLSTLKRLYGKNNKFGFCVAVLWGIVCVVFNVIYTIINHAVPDKGFEKSFKIGILNLSDKIVICAGLLFVLCLITAIIMIAVKDFKTGFAVLLCFCAGLCSSTILGFSSSIYASGQRVFFFSEILMLVACAILFSKLQNAKMKSIISKIVFAFALTMYFTDCFSFAFMETPFMG